MQIIIKPNNKLSLNIYDKRKEFPFTVIRYPHMDSLLPRSIPYGVFVGQLRYHRICSLPQHFIGNTVELVKLLKLKGYKLKRLKRDFMNFIKYNTIRYRQKWLELFLEFQKLL